MSRRKEVDGVTAVEAASGQHVCHMTAGVGPHTQDVIQANCAVGCSAQDLPSSSLRCACGLRLVALTTAAPLWDGSRCC